MKKQKEFANFLGSKYRATPLELLVSAMGPANRAVDKLKHSHSEKVDPDSSVPTWEQPNARPITDIRVMVKLMEEFKNA